MGTRLSRIRSWALTFDCVPRRLVAFYLFLACLLIFLATQVSGVGGDSPGIAYLPAALLRDGTLRLDNFVDQNPFFELERSPHYIVEFGGHYYSKFSPVPSLIALPVYALGLALSRGIEQEITREAFLFVTLSRIVAALIASTITVVVFGTARFIVRQSVALLLSLAYALGTFTWAWATSTLASQSSGELFLALSLLILMQLHQDAVRGTRSVLQFWYGLCLGASVASRPQLFPVALIMVAYVAVKVGRDAQCLGGIALGVTAVAVPWGCYNTWAFGNPFITGYRGEALGGWTTPLWIGLPAMLFSPGHGLLVYSPILALGASLGGWAVLTQRVAVQIPSDRPQPEKRYRLLGRFAFAAVIVQLLLMSHWWAWHGGAAYNQRMLEEVHPLMMLLTALGIAAHGERRIVAGLLFGSALWGGFMNVCRVAFADQHNAWLQVFHPEVVWSWQHLEPLVYLRWHGTREFSAGVLSALLRVAVILVGSALLLHLRSGRRNSSRSRYL